MQEQQLTGVSSMTDAQLTAEVMREPQIDKVSEYRPSNKEALCEYEINIRFLSRGCVVRVGCKEIAFEDVASAMAAINAYVANPWEEQQKWRKILN